MKRRTVFYRRDTEIVAFAERRGIDYSSAVNLLIGLALDTVVPRIEQPEIPGLERGNNEVLGR